MSKSLDPDQAQHFVGPDLGPNWLQRFSAYDTCKGGVVFGIMNESLSCQYLNLFISMEYSIHNDTIVWNSPFCILSDCWSKFKKKGCISVPEDCLYLSKQYRSR